MHVLPGGIDVGNQAIDHHVRVVIKRERVAGHHGQPAGMPGQVGRHAVSRRRRWGSTMWSGSSPGYSAASSCGRRLPPPGPPPAAQPVLADQQIQPETDPGLKKNDRQPGQAGGRPFLAQYDHRQHRQANRPFAGGQQRPKRHVHRIQGAFGSWIGGEGFWSSGGTGGTSILITKGRPKSSRKRAGRRAAGFSAAAGREPLVCEDEDEAAVMGWDESPCGEQPLKRSSDDSENHP